MRDRVGKTVLNSLSSAGAAMRLLGTTRSTTSARMEKLCAFVGGEGGVDEWGLGLGVEVGRFRFRRSRT
jgi:hypothetical protein